MSDRFNSSKMWDELLQDKNYLSDFNKLVVMRCDFAKKFVLKHKEIKCVLNIGSGQGYLEKMFDTYLKRLNWLSMDISIEGLKRLKKFSPKLLFGYAHAIPLKPQSIDCCVCMEVLEHIPKDKLSNVLLEIKRVLRINSYLIVSVPIYEPISLVNHPVGHMRKYVPKEIRLELESSGFDIIKEDYFFAFKNFYSVKSFVSKLFRLRRPSVLIYICKKIQKT